MKLKDLKPLPLSEVKSPQKTKRTDGQLPIDVFENQNEILIATPIAGVDPDQVEISITEDVMTISGERLMDLGPFEFKLKDAYLKECYWGKFTRSLVLPAAVQIESIEATQKNHILYIKIPKKKGVKMRIVKIKSNHD